MRFQHYLLPSTLLTLSLIGASVTGCADNNTSLFVDHAVPRLSGEECVAEFSATSSIISSGIYDSAIDCGYQLTLQLGSQLQSLGDNETLRAETSRISIEGAEVAILDAAKNEVIPEFSTNQNGTIAPALGSAPAYGGVTIAVIPPGLDLESGEYVIRVRGFGQTLGNTPVQSNYFFFPVTVGVNLESAACEGIPCSVGQDECYPEGAGCGL